VDAQDGTCSMSHFWNIVLTPRFLEKLCTLRAVTLQVFHAASEWTLSKHEVKMIIIKES